MKTEIKYYIGFLLAVALSFSKTSNSQTCNNASVVSNPQASNITSISATISWNSLPGAVNYHMESFKLPPVGFPSSTYWSDTSELWSGLQTGATYVWKIRANCGAGVFSQWSPVTQFTTMGCDSALNLIVTGLQTTNINLSNALLSWDSIPGAVSYELRGKKIAPTVSPANTTTNVSKNSIKATGLLSGAVYQWEVRAYTTSNVSCFWSGLTQFPTGFCDNPSGTNTNSITNSSATLDWLPIAYQNVLGYQVIGGTLGNFNTTLNIVNPSITQLSASQLPSSTTFNWGVLAACQDGTGQFVFSSAAGAPINVFTTLGPSEKLVNETEQQSNPGNFEVYPNPATNYVNIDVNEVPVKSGWATVRVYDSKGIPAIEQIAALESKSISIDVGSIPNGAYHMTIEVNGVESFRQKLIIAD